MKELAVEVCLACADHKLEDVVNACTAAIQLAMDRCSSAAEIVICNSVLTVSVGEMLRNRFRDKATGGDGKLFQDIEFDVNEIRGGL